MIVRLSRSLGNTPGASSTEQDGSLVGAKAPPMVREYGLSNADSAAYFRRRPAVRWSQLRRAASPLATGRSSGASPGAPGVRPASCARADLAASGACPGAGVAAELHWFSRSHSYLKILLWAGGFVFLLLCYGVLRRILQLTDECGCLTGRRVRRPFALVSDR
jgi:hypothetical protein